MSKTTFEKLGIPYEERDGIFYPVLVAGTEKADIDVGKYGRMWIKYIKEEYPMRYKSLVRFGELEERADEVNDTAYVMRYMASNKAEISLIEVSLSISS